MIYSSCLRRRSTMCAMWLSPTCQVRPAHFFFCLGLSTYTATLSTLTVADLVFVVPSLAHTWAVLLGETRVGVTFCLQRYVRAELLSIHGRAT